jgi:hypothetical protein
MLQTPTKNNISWNINLCDSVVCLTTTTLPWKNVSYYEWNYALSNSRFALKTRNDIPILVQTRVNSLHAIIHLNTGLQRGQLVKLRRLRSMPSL